MTRARDTKTRVTTMGLEPLLSRGVHSADLIGTGYCTGTVEGWEGDCTRGHVGSWKMGPSMPNARACINRCRECRRCRFVSISVKNGECSWFSGCATGSLALVYGGDTYTTYRVKKRPKCAVAGLETPAHTAAETNRSSGGVHFVTFYSEGPPRDPGIPLGAMAGLVEATFAPHVDSFRGYTPTSVRSL